MTLARALLALYGFPHFGLISGFITTVHHSAGDSWPIWRDWSSIRQGVIELAFILSAIMALVAVFSSILIIERRHQAIQ